MRNEGITLIELIVVMALIAILATVLLPRIRDQISKGKDVRVISTLGALRTLSESYYAEFEKPPFGDELPREKNKFKEIQETDKPRLALLIPKLSIQGVKLFGANSNWKPGDGYTAPIGGAREESDGKVKYSGEIGYTFHAPAGTSADGISLWFTKYTSPDGLEFDTKGLEWIEY